MNIGYARVSTRKQAVDGNGLQVQEDELKAAGAEEIYSDSYTGTVANRPEFDKMLSRLRPGDKLIVTKLDRIARTASHGCDLIQSLQDRDIAVHVLNMGLMDSSPTGKLVTQIMFAFAEFERNMIIERTHAGIEKAREAGNLVMGRPKKFNREQILLALKLTEEYSLSQVEKMTGISRSTICRAKRIAAGDKDQQIVS